mgnify:CR=1 FL=1
MKSILCGGNNDFFSRLPREEEFDIGKYHVFITHGHYYYVSMDVDTIIEEARSRNADIVMFGHTHKTVIFSEGRTYRSESGESFLSKAGWQETKLYGDGNR